MPRSRRSPLPHSASVPRRAALAVAVLALLAGCETSVVIDAPELENALVVYAFPQADSVWSVRVGRTLPLGAVINGDPLPSEVQDATVRLFEGEALLDELVFEAGLRPPGRYVSRLGLRPTPGTTYRLEVTAPGLPMAVAETTLPLPPEVELTRNEWEQVTVFGDGSLEGERGIGITLTDLPGEDVYEMAILRQDRSDMCPDGLCNEILNGFRSSSPSLRDGYDLLDVDVTIEENEPFTFAVFRDALFEARRQRFDLTFDLFIFNGFGSASTVENQLFVARVSEPFAEYQKALQNQDLNEDNPFAEPTPLYSNVQGGHGVVGGFSAVRVPLPTPEATGGGS
ncbi:MAG: DUF4249 domain-containing protein [Bacteroidota bacterium]